MSMSSLVTHNLPLTPAFFVIGDSSVDCGTNNFLGTFARADHLPYGRDFDTHRPTGRFCNGRIPVDYLALRLGLPFVPSYLGQPGTVEHMIHGVNYASAGAGIIFSSGSELGQHISFTHQIQQFTDTFQQFILSMGENAANDLISKSVVYVSIGINDYIHYYLRNVSNVQNLYLPWSFNQFLASTVGQEIKNLYNIHINDMVMEFNFAMRYMVEELNEELPDSNIIFCDVYQGFNVTTEACCGFGKYKGWIMCLSPEMACSNASTYIWWDQFHPTDAVNAILADNVWNGLHTKMCYPKNLKDIVISKAK
ncbi:GDSL esterase/lipase [Quillaja saponaria]|uniref:GDSL esterase/lipase n=1 Tax=Quillaja saponaria TaxID=32244 RepID=A0AAD7L5W8_QUISA|nr:GDSL esterase/lipase [Quillaja saponaria]